MSGPRAFDPAPAAAMLASAWRSGTLLTKLPEAIRPATVAQGYDVQDRMIEELGQAVARGMALPRGSIVSTGSVSRPFNLAAAPAARVSARFLGRELGFLTLVRPGGAGPD